jgi:hypothetical protein
VDGRATELGHPYPADQGRIPAPTTIHRTGNGLLDRPCNRSPPKKQKDEEPPARKKNRFADAAQDGLDKAQTRAETINEETEAKNQQANSELDKTDALRQQLELDSAIARAKTNAANTVAMVNLAGASASFAMGAAKANADKPDKGGSVNTVEQGSGPYVLEYEDRGGTYDLSGSQFTEWTRLRIRYATKAERDQIKGSIEQQVRALGAVDRLRNVRTYDETSTSPNMNDSLAMQSGGITAQPGFAFDPPSSSEEADAAQALHQATQTDADPLNAIASSETAQRAADLLERTNEANADTLRKTGDLSADGIKDNLNQSARDMLTEQAREVAKQIIRDGEARRKYGKDYGDLDAAEGMDVDWEIMTKEAHSFGAMSRDDKKEWLGEKMNQVGHRIGQFFGEQMPSSNKPAPSAKPDKPQPKAEPSKDEKGWFDRKIQELMSPEVK